MHSLFSATPPSKNKDKGFDMAWDAHVPETEESYTGAEDEPAGAFAIDDRDGQLYFIPTSSHAFIWDPDETTIVDWDLWDQSYTRSQDYLCASVCAESFYRIYPSPLRITYLKSKHEGKYIYAHTCVWNSRILEENAVEEYSNGSAMIWLFTHATSETLYDQYKEAQDGVHSYPPVCVLPEAQTSVRPSPSEIKDAIRVDEELFMKMSLQIRSSIVKTLSTTRVLACPSNSPSMDELEESLHTGEIVETDQEDECFEDEEGDGEEDGDYELENDSIMESLDYEHILEDVQGVVDNAMGGDESSLSSSIEVTFSPTKMQLSDFKTRSYSSLSEFVLSPRASNSPMKSPIFFAASQLTPARSELLDMDGPCTQSTTRCNSKLSLFGDERSRSPRACMQSLGGAWDELDTDAQRLIVGHLADSILANPEGQSAVAQYETIVLVSSTMYRLLKEELVLRIQIGAKQAMHMMTCYDGSTLGQLGDFVRRVYATYACPPRYLLNLSTRARLVFEWKRMRMNHSPSVDVIKLRAMK